MIPFLKMHGLGNDFVILDARDKPLPGLNWRKIADRHAGIGCDQIVVLEKSDKADIFMRIYNADGGEAASCGNASRCVAWLGVKEQESWIGQRKIRIETLAGTIEAEVNGDQATVDMGKPGLDWRDIPLAQEMDTLHLPVSREMLRDPVGVSMGNPHMVFFAEDIDDIPLEDIGPVLEKHALFPERANVNVAQVETKDKIRLRVWERGAGLTLACGTGACATLVAAVRRGLAGRKAEVMLPGGSLRIEWRDNDHVFMTGPVALSFEGTFGAKQYE